MLKILTYIVLFALLYNLFTGRPILPQKSRNRKEKPSNEDEFDDYEELDE